MRLGYAAGARGRLVTAPRPRHLERVFNPHGRGSALALYHELRLPLGSLKDTAFLGADNCK
jgi:hypothetical protein